MKVYLSGPMTGIEDFNFPLFNDAARRLRDRGYEVVNPAEVNPDPSTSRAECMRNDIRALLDCDAIAMMPGWSDSAGATLERAIAREIGLRIADLHQVLRTWALKS